MRKNLFISNFKKFPSGFMLCIVFFILAEIYLQHLGYKKLPAIDAAFIEKRKLFDGLNPQSYDGIVMGDSRSVDLDGKELAEKISAMLNRDFSVSNFSCHYQDIRGYYLILRTYLQHHRKPRVILFSSMPESLFEGWNINGPMELRANYIHRFCMLFSLKDAFDVFPFHIFREIMPYEIRRYSYIFTFRGYWRNSFEKNFYLKTNLAAAADAAHVTPGYRPAEGNLVPRLECLRYRISKSCFNKQSPRVNKESYAWMKRFFALAYKNEIPVILFNMPIPRPFFEKREQDMFHERYRKMIGDLTDEFDNVIILQPLLQEYDLTYFRDDNHLNKQGCERYYNQFIPLALEQIIRLQ